MRRYNYRINRVTYAVYLAIFVIAYAVMAIAMKRPPALAEALVAFVAIPRLHDIGRSGWWLLILLGAELAAIAIGWRSGVEGISLGGGLVVFAALGALIVLALVPGQQCANTWGVPPAPGVHFRRPDRVAGERTAPPVSGASKVPIFAFVSAAALSIGAALYLLSPTYDANAVAVVSDDNVPSSDIVVLVQGWNERELRRILADFLVKYSLDANTFAIERSDDQTLSVHATRDLNAAQFFFLVNYIDYPEGFDLTHRALSVLGALTLSRRTGLPPDARGGEIAWVYMPANDRDYDLAYLRRASGQTYRISFTNMAWEPVSDPRLPQGVQGLLSRSLPK